MSIQVDRDLVDQMFNYAGPFKPSDYETRSEYGIKMTGERVSE